MHPPRVRYVRPVSPTSGSKKRTISMRPGSSHVVDLKRKDPSKVFPRSTRMRAEPEVHPSAALKRTRRRERPQPGECGEKRQEEEHLGSEFRARPGPAPPGQAAGGRGAQEREVWTRRPHDWSFCALLRWCRGRSLPAVAWGGAGQSRIRSSTMEEALLSLLSMSLEALDLIEKCRQEVVPELKDLTTITLTTIKVCLSRWLAKHAQAGGPCRPPYGHHFHHLASHTCSLSHPHPPTPRYAGGA
jgi:hypothetical protein